MSKFYHSCSLFLLVFDSSRFFYLFTSSINKFPTVPVILPRTGRAEDMKIHFLREEIILLRFRFSHRASSIFISFQSFSSSTIPRRLPSMPSILNAEEIFHRFYDIFAFHVWKRLGGNFNLCIVCAKVRIFRKDARVRFNIIFKQLATF